MDEDSLKWNYRMTERIDEVFEISEGIGPLRNVDIFETIYDGMKVQLMIDRERARELGGQMLLNLRIYGRDSKEFTGISAMSGFPQMTIASVVLIKGTKLEDGFEHFPWHDGPNISTYVRDHAEVIASQRDLRDLFGRYLHD